MKTSYDNSFKTVVKFLRKKICEYCNKVQQIHDQGYFNSNKNPF
jgi:hypothetical protein